ncbi:MAG: MFS transporter [Candidatus Sumerlaeaceae bacterium]|nr:MFS transporter [Candidatus Sumerlaeaceae bacterium]
MFALFHPLKWCGLDLGRHRWLFPLTGAVCTTLIGAVYAFSVFVKPLEDEFGWHRQQTTLAFSVAMFMFGLSASVGGLGVDRLGPRPVFTTGALLMVLAQILASRVHTLGMLVWTYGVMLGIGIGFVYSACTVALQSRWFPDVRRRGVAIGFALMGMGLGSALAAPLWAWGISLGGWRATYFVTGLVFLVLLAIAGTIIRFPARNQVFLPDSGWQVAAEVGGQHNRQSSEQPGLTFRKAAARREFWLLGLLFFLTVFGGLMVIAQLAAFAAEPAPGGPGFSRGAAVFLVTALAVMNGVGRPTWGWMSAHLGTKFCLIVCPLVMMVAQLALTSRSSAVVAAGVLLTGFSFGGMLALLPVMTAAMFGPARLGAIYGVVFFLGFGLGGLAGPPTGGWLREVMGNYNGAFVVSGIMAALSSVMAWRLLPDPGRERLYEASGADGKG